MTTNATHTVQHIMTGATIGGGALEWLTLNSSAITALAVASTAIASIAFGFWNAKSNSDRNKVNRRNIVDTLVSELKSSGKSDDYIEDLLLVLRR